MKKDSAYAFEETGSGASTGKYDAEYKMPIPAPAMI